MSTPNPNTAPPAKRFRIAFSFAGEKRPFVKQVAEAVAARFGEEAVLYDHFHEAEFARARLGRFLPTLYHEQSDLVVVIICQDYSRKEWPGLEWDAIFDLLKRREEHHVMLCRFDRAKIDGLFSDAGYSECDDKTPAQAAQLILERLALNEGKPRDHYFSHVPPPKPAPFVWPTDDPGWDRLVAAYHQHLIDRFGKLTLYSLSSDQPIAVDLERVFVKFTTTEKKALPASDRYSYDLAEEFPGWDQAELAKSVSGTTRSGRAPAAKLPQETTATLSLPQALRAHSHLAIIGAPGAGKTTALKWLALACARRQVKERLDLDEDRLPLFVTLRDFNRFLDNLEKGAGLPGQLPPSLLARHLQEYYAEHVAHLRLPADFFLRALATGRALVLLDGLDEVAVAAKRTRAAEFVAACVRAYPGCRFVLTSRPRGYENDCRTQLAALCSECRVRDFDDDDIAAFSRNWYLAVTLARAGDNPTTRDQAESAAKNLQAAVQQERVRPLAANPLLLSILALIHQKGVGLPQRRVELYSECTEFLLGYWDQVRGGDTARELANLGGLTRQEKCALLEPIALWIHERGEQGTEVSRKELETKLAEQFRERFADADARARLRAKEFVDLIEQRAGLLVEREQDTFAFTHLTFQEYLAARALSDREDFVAETLKHLHDPWWREVHLLEVAHLSTPNTRRSRADTGKLLTAIQGAGSWLEDDLHRDLLFAFHALCDVGPLGVETAFRQELTQTVFDLWWTTPVEALQYRIAERFQYAGATPVGSLLAETLLRLTKDENDSTRSRGAQGLGWLGGQAATSAVLTRLLELSKDANNTVRHNAAGSLSRLGPAAATPDILARLIALIQDADDDVGRTAAVALGALGRAAATPATLARLVALSQDAHGFVRCNAVAALGRLGTAAAAPDVVARLVALNQDTDSSVRGSAAVALGRLGAVAATPDVLARLVLLCQDAKADTRRTAAIALGQLGDPAATAHVLARLVALIQDPHDDVRRTAGIALSRLGATAATPDVLSRLVGLCQGTHDDVRINALVALGQLGAAAITPDVLTRLVALSRDATPAVRGTAAGALGRLGAAAATSDVLARLVDLSRDPHDIVRGNAAEALGQLGAAAATPAVLARLIALCHDGHHFARSNAAWAIGQLGAPAATPDALARMVALIHDVDAGVRNTAAGVLGQLPEKLESSQANSLADWCRTNLANRDFAIIGNVYQAVFQTTFDILHRLAAQRTRPGPD